MVSRWTWIVPAALVLFAAGCGGSADSSSTTSAQTSVSSSSTTTTSAAAGVPTAATPLADQIDALERAGKSPDCALALQVVAEVRLPDPEGGDSAANCKQALDQVGVIRGFEAGKSEEFGTGALVDGTQDGKELTLILTLDGSRNFTWAGLTLSRAQVGKPLEGSDYGANAERLLAALRAGDCHAAYDTIATATRLSYSSEQEFCSVFDDNFMAARAGLGARLRADCNAKLTDLGGSTDAYFYGLVTKPAGYRTVVVTVATHGDPLVIDVVPVER